MERHISQIKIREQRKRLLIILISPFDAGTHSMDCIQYIQSKLDKHVFKILQIYLPKNC